MTKKEILYIMETTKDPFIEAKMMNIWPIEGHREDSLIFTGLTKLTEPAAQALKARVKRISRDEEDWFYGGALTIEFPDLKELPDNVARKLARLCAPETLQLSLEMRSLVYLSDVAARAIASTDWYNLNLPSASGISEKALTIIAKAKVMNYLGLYIPSDISSEVIEQFQQNSYAALGLDIGELTTESAEALSGIESSLSLIASEISTKDADILKGSVCESLSIQAGYQTSNEALAVLSESRRGIVEDEQFYSDD